MENACEVKWGECSSAVARDTNALQDILVWAEYYEKKIDLEDKQFRHKRAVAETHCVRALRGEIDALVASAEDTHGTLSQSDDIDDTRNVIVRKAISDFTERGVDYEIIRRIAEDLLHPGKPSEESATRPSDSGASDTAGRHHGESMSEFKNRYDDMIPNALFATTLRSPWDW